MSSLIKIFKQLYIGYNMRVEVANEPPIKLGFATPYEDNAAGRKRQSTVDAWTKGYNRQGDPLPTEIIDNLPLKGFAISKSVRRYGWNGGNVLWRIDDPRGFQLEISSGNLAQIITEVGLAKDGVITQPCIWGRLGADNILIPEGSSLWENALHDIEKFQQKISAEKIAPSKLDIGDRIKLFNDSEVTYLGRYWFTGLTKTDTGERPGYWNATEEITYTFVPQESKQFYLVQIEDYYNGQKQVRAYRDLKVLNLLKKNFDGLSTVDQALALLNDQRTRRKSATSSSSGDSFFDYGFFTVNKPESEIKLVERKMDTTLLDVLAQRGPVKYAIKKDDDAKQLVRLQVDTVVDGFPMPPSKNVAVVLTGGKLEGRRIMLDDISTNIDFSSLAYGDYAHAYPEYKTHRSGFKDSVALSMSRLLDIMYEITNDLIAKGKLKLVAPYGHNNSYYSGNQKSPTVSYGYSYVNANTIKRHYTRHSFVPQMLGGYNTVTHNDRQRLYDLAAHIAYTALGNCDISIITYEMDGLTHLLPL